MMDRYSFDALAAVARQRYLPTEHTRISGDIGKVARALNMEPSGIYRWREEGLTWMTADRVAVRLGLHPAEIWPTWFDDADQRHETAIKAERLKKRRQRRARQASNKSHAPSEIASTG